MPYPDRTAVQSRPGPEPRNGRPLNSTAGYNESYCSAAGIVKTFAFDACVLSLTCYVVHFRKQLNSGNAPKEYRGIPLHRLALASITMFSSLHAFVSQDVVVVDRINQKDELPELFSFYKSNKCLAFGKHH